jgi:sugar phosphate isomerase/epimerase
MWSIGFDEVKPAKPMSAYELLEKSHELGVSLVQYAPNCPVDTLSDRELERIIRKAGEWNMDLELAAGSLDREHMLRHVELAKQMGSPLVRTLLVLDGKRESLANCIKPLREILPFFEKAGLKLAIENVHTPAAELRKLFEDFNHPLLGIIVDTTNNLQVSEGYQYVAEQTAPYVMGLHMKDFVMTRYWNWMGFTCEGAPAGKGQTDLPWLMETFKASPHDYNVVLEQWPPEQASLKETIRLEHAWAPESIAYLRQYIKD